MVQGTTRTPYLMTHRRATVCLQHEFVIPLSARFHESWPFRKRTDVCQPMDRSTLHPKEVCGLCYGSGRNGERERETARPKERLQSVPGNWEAKGGRTFLILLCLDVPGESLSWFHHGRDLCVKDLEGTFLMTFLFFFPPFSFPFNIYDLSIFAGKLTTLKRNRCIWCI